MYLFGSKLNRSVYLYLAFFPVVLRRRKGETSGNTEPYERYTYKGKHRGGRMWKICHYDLFRRPESTNFLFQITHVYLALPLPPSKVRRVGKVR